MLECSEYNFGNIYKNNSNEEIRIETNGDSIVVSITQNRKTNSFTIPYNDRVMLEDLKRTLVLVQSHAQKNHAGNVRRQCE